MGRLIGMSYRIKKTVKNEPRPTMVAIKSGDKTVEYALETEDDELDFAKKQFPVSWRTIGVAEDISVFKPHHCKWRKVKNEEEILGLNEAHMRRVQTGRGSQVEICTDVPVAFEGLQEGDKVAMVLGAR